MAYAPPSIGPSGLTFPVYPDIRDDLLAQFQSIYGQNTYLATDTGDYQMISAFAAKVNDAMSSLQLAYNSRSPQSAIGAALDSLGKLVGISRKAATSSTATIAVSGTPDAVLNNVVLSDSNGFLWDLPPQITIGSGGTLSVIATCETAGAIVALAGQISNLTAAQAGLSSATNPADALTGLPIELDSSYKARLTLSASLPSLTMRAAVQAAIAATANVTRYNVLENYFGYTASVGTCSTSGTAFTLLSGFPLDSTDVGEVLNINGSTYTISAVGGGGTSATLASSAGTQTNVAFYVGDGTAQGPKNSLTTVVEGGASADVANAIYLKRGIGCFTNGSTSVTVTDAYTGATMPIRFSTPTYVPIFVSLSIRQLTGYSSATTAAIQAAIAGYLNSLQIGENVVFSEMYGAALTARPNPDTPLFSIRALTLGISASPSGTSDLTIAYNQVAQGSLVNVVITLV